MADGEVLLEVKCNVKFKKNDGTLRVLKNNIEWILKDATIPKFDCKYSDIKVQRISPDSSSKVQLQIVLLDDKSYNFHFASKKGRDYEFKKRNQVKELLAQLIPASRVKVNKDIEEKSRLLKENPELYTLYKDLVKGEIITADEFWENRNLNKDNDLKKQSQEIGISSGFLAELKPDMHGCNELRFNLTADNIEAIFKTYPGVRRKYESSVPDEMTEEQFWTEFFRSRHFHRERYTTSKSSKDLFGECAEKDEQKQLEENIKTFFDPILDLTNTDALPEEGYGQGLSSSRPSANVPLIRKFNHQSLMVLKTSSKRDLENKGKRNEEEAKKAKLQEALEYDDLESHQNISTPSLKILDADKFALFTNRANTESMNGITNNQHSDSLQYYRQNILNWTPDLPNVLSSEQACAALAEVSPGSKLMNMSMNANYSNQLSTFQQQEMRQQNRALSEILRHFWSCFPIKTQQLEEKVIRMASCLEKYRDNKLNEFRKMTIPSDGSKLVDHLDRRLEAALEKFQTWQQRRSSR
eukprot:gene18270-20090_t